MKGIRKRVLVSFLSVVFLLFFAGLVSLFELRRVSSDTEEILRASERNLELAKEMLDAAALQNKAVVHNIVFEQQGYDTVLRASINRMAQTMEIVREEALDQTYLDSLSSAVTDVQRLTQKYIRIQANRMSAKTIRLHLPADSDSVHRVIPMNFDGARWYAETYSKAYDKLTGSIKDYMISTQSSLAPQTEQLKRNAYRSVTPVLISLMVMIAIVVMLYYFISAYLTRPLLTMNKALGDYLRFGLPFKVKAECRDEAAELKERIGEVIQSAKKAKAEQR
ncbi:hypothetical protein [uncultured Alistipes sp.]|uniref:hypothetical protein n=1 Tax=uncultured Alistipes sp. TaxID=538949 RepID=UPI0026313553|nr:hypothetical protein [uncultured Alistipes sp.]